MKNELKKLPFTIAQLLIPFLVLLDAACWNPYVMSQDMVNYLIYAVIMIWFSFEVASIACMRFEDDYSMCSLRNKICFWIFRYYISSPFLFCCISTIRA